MRWWEASFSTAEGVIKCQARDVRPPKATERVADNCAKSFGTRKEV